MPAKKLPKNNNSIQTGKTLPNRVTSYNPSRAQPVPANQPGVEPVKKYSRLKRIILLIVLTVFLFVITIGLWDMRNISVASQKIFGTGNVLSLLGSGRLSGSEKGRVNVLLVGYSIDDPGHPAANLTDSLILLSMSTTSKRGYMLSIPRDLYVNIPKFGYAKINEAYKDGGMGLLEQVVETNFQTQIDYYALINYASVRETVDALGGVAVDIKSQDPRGLFDSNISKVDGGPLDLKNGLQTLDGQTALNFTRARGDSYNSYGFTQADFDRTQHQRQILAAIKDKLNWKLILNPRKNSQILNAVAENVKTDVPAGEARALFSLFNSIPSSKLTSLSLRNLNGQNYLSSYTTSYGQSALIPRLGISNYSEINKALENLNH